MRDGFAQTYRHASPEENSWDGPQRIPESSVCMINEELGEVCRRGHLGLGREAGLGPFFFFPQKSLPGGT